MHDSMLPGLPGILALKPSYLRYKPGTSVFAAVHVEGMLAQAVAYPVGAHDKLGRLVREASAAGELIRADEKLGIAIVTASADRDLPGVREALRRHPNAEPLAYKPARRWVARCVECGVIIKAHSTGRAAAALAGHRTLAPLVPTAEIVRVGVDGVIETRILPGSLVADEAGAHAAGRILARLHAAPTPAAPRPDDAPVAGSLAAVLPALAARESRLADGIREARAVSSRRVPVHGDFSADQVVTGPAGTFVIDLDRAGLDDPHVDLGSWIADEIARGVPRARAGSALREGYLAEGGLIVEAALLAHSAAGVLRRAVEPFRRQEEDWPAECERMLVEAEALLALARVRGDAALPGSGAATAGAVVVAHRAERRAVLRTDAGFAKLTRASRFAGVADRAERVTGLTALRSPRILRRNDEHATLILDGVGERTLLEAGRELSDEDFRAVWQTVGAGLAELAELDPTGLPQHGIDDELAAIRRALDGSGLRAPAEYARAERGLRSGSGSEGVLHRDLHDKQLLLPADGISPVGLIDVDTLAVGERALDVANLVVHLELREVQGILPEGRARVASRALRGCLDDRGIWERVPAYAAATRLRLAGVYASRPGGGHASREMLRRVGAPTP
jgi:aminoglycoside phosphotransferase (APT) family kinase protein